MKNHWFPAYVNKKQSRKSILINNAMLGSSLFTDSSTQLLTHKKEEL